MDYIDDFKIFKTFAVTPLACSPWFHFWPYFYALLDYRPWIMVVLLLIRSICLSCRASFITTLLGHISPWALGRESMGSYVFKAVSVIIYHKTQKNTVHFVLMYQPLFSSYLFFNLFIIQTRVFYWKIYHS